MPCNTCVSARMRHVAIIDQGVLVRSAILVIQPTLAAGAMPHQRWNPPPKRRHEDPANACGRGNDAPTLGSKTQAPTRGDPAKACGQAATAEKQVTIIAKYIDEHVEKVVDEHTDAWPSWVKAGKYNYDNLVQNLAERLAMPMAKLNYAMFYGLDEVDISEETIKISSASVYGWADTKYVIC